MKIIYLHQYFKYPRESGGTRSYWITKALVERGHKVVVITSRNNMNKTHERLQTEGFEIIYINTPYDNNMGIWKRLRAFLNFMFKATLFSLQEKKVNMVFATSTPLTIGFPALILKWFRRIPFVFEVRDLWPEAPIQMGVIKNKSVIYCLTIFEKTIYNNAKSIIALSPGMEKGVFECVNGSKTIAMIPNMAKIDLFYPRKKEKNMSKYIDFDKFNVIYFGTIGVSNNLNYLVDAAKLLSKSKDNSINFIILGEGKDKPMLEKLIEENNLKNIRLISSKPLLETSEIVNACDISLVIFKNIPILRTNSPNKLFDSLSAAKPIIVNSSGWTKTLVEEERCGFYANPNTPQDLINKIKILKEDKQLYQEFSTNALNLAREKFDKSILVKEVTNIIEESSV